MTQDITAVDFFCGAGGSSTGLVNAGIRVKGAANHWALAIETHNTNHPHTDHYLDDLQQAHAKRFPRADIAWFSPECTNHSLAKGKKRKGINQLDLWGDNKVDPAEERSRATMREVVEFTEYHRYEIVIVENVVDIRKWQFYDEWLTAMLNLGYHHKVLYLNAQFFGVPQSRNRFYAVFWKKGNRAPQLDFRPPAMCPKHGLIHAVQVWKKPDFPWGNYGKHGQYLYRCPQCGHDVMPEFRPAADVIDWSIPSEKIGDRKQPLKEKTIQRILAGLKKFGHYSHVADLGHSHAAHNAKVHPVTDPLPTETSQQRQALVQPFMLSYANQESPPREVSDPLFAIATGYTPRLVIPSFITSYYSRQDEKGWPVSKFDEALPVIPTEPRHALVTSPFMVILKNSHSDDGKYTLPPRALNDPLTTLVGSASQHGLVTPPFLIVQRGTGTVDGIANPVSLDEPMRVITTSEAQHYLVTPFVMAYYSNPVFKSVNEPLPTIPTLEHHALVTPEDVLPECGFRMLEPHELKLGMSFPDSYVILGNKRDQVRQIGNAVCCNVAEFIARRCVESLS